MTSLGLGFGAPPFYSIIANIESLLLSDSGIPVPLPCVQFAAPGQYPHRWNVFPSDVTPPTRKSCVAVLTAASALLRNYLAAVYSTPPREGGVGAQVVTSAALMVLIDAAARVRTARDGYADLAAQSALFRTLTGYSAMGSRQRRLRSGSAFGVPVTANGEK